jgi:hypothetical protein
VGLEERRELLGPFVGRHRDVEIQQRFELAFLIADKP